MQVHRRSSSQGVGRRAALGPMLAVASLAVGCAAHPIADSTAQANAAVAPTAGNTAAGKVSFEQRSGRTLVTARITGLTPGAEHGFHVHEKGDCSSPDAASAGGHFNPGARAHGHHGSAERHAGDMPNLRADAQGVATLTWDSEQLTVAAGPASVAERSVIVHRDADDHRSQPAGNSGPRIACGVIRAG